MAEMYRTRIIISKKKKLFFQKGAKLSENWNLSIACGNNLYVMSAEEFDVMVEAEDNCRS